MLIASIIQLLLMEKHIILVVLPNMSFWLERKQIPKMVIVGDGQKICSNLDMKTDSW